MGRECVTVTRRWPQDATELPRKMRQALSDSTGQAGVAALSTAEAARRWIEHRSTVNGGLSHGDLPDTVRAAFEIVADEKAGEVYTRQLTHSHYENFSVVSILLPKHLRQDFCNVYAFCRVADDLGDEVPEREKALGYLAEFRRQLVRLL